MKFNPHSHTDEKNMLNRFDLGNSEEWRHIAWHPAKESESTTRHREKEIRTDEK